MGAIYLIDSLGAICYPSQSVLKHKEKQQSGVWWSSRLLLASQRGLLLVCQLHHRADAAGAFSAEAEGKELHVCPTGHWTGAVCLTWTNLPAQGINAGLLSNCQPVQKEQQPLQNHPPSAPTAHCHIGFIKTFFCHHYLKIKMGLVLNPLCARREGHLTQWICCSYGKCWA